MIAVLNQSTGSAASTSGLPPAGGRTIDLRTFLELLDEAGYLVRVSEPVNWKLELGARARQSNRPLLFETIQDYPGHRVLTNGLCDGRTIAFALGRNADAPQATLVEDTEQLLANPPAPVMVEHSPVLENIVEGANVDLLSLPVPQWSPHETARYIGTWHLNITRDPETRARNVGVYRMQVLSSNRATVSASSKSDLACHVLKAERLGQRLPMAVAIGVPEVTVIAAGADCPPGMDEYELAGAMQRHGIELVLCPALDLEVPASSEIVIEGFIQPGERTLDGPYFDYCGRPNSNPQAFVFEASRMMFRSQPIFRGAAIGLPGAEDHQLFAFLAQLDMVSFHGSRMRQRVQSALWKRRAFRALQFVGQLRSTLRKT